MRFQVAMIPVGIGGAFRSVLSLGLAVSLLAAAAPSAHAAEVDATSDPTHVWGAPILAVNPKDPNNLVLMSIGIGATEKCTAEAATDPKSPCASMKTSDGRSNLLGFVTDTPGFVMIGAWASFDRGKTWTNTAQVKEGGNVPVFPPDKYTGPAEADADGLTVTPNGTFYMAWDAVYFSDIPLYETFGAIPITQSTDGGKTWSTPIRTGSAPDGGRLITDPATGIMYTFSSGRPGPGPDTLGDPNIRHSKDVPHTGMSRFFLSSEDGVHWSEPHITGGGGGSMTVSHGVLATAFKTTAGQDYLSSGRSPPNNELCGDAPKPCTIFETTTDGGATWERTVMAVPNDYTGTPVVAADPRKAGHFTIVFTTNSNAELDVYRTANAGKTWKGPTKIAGEPGKVITSVTTTYGANGDLGLAWRSRTAAPRAPAGAQGGPGGGGGVTGGGGGFGQLRTASNIFAALSKDGGATVSAPVKINSEISPAPPTDRPFALSRDGGVSMVLNGGSVFFAWPDWRTGEASILFDAVKLSAFKMSSN